MPELNQRSTSGQQSGGTHAKVGFESGHVGLVHSFDRGERIPQDGWIIFIDPFLDTIRGPILVHFVRSKIERRLLESARMSY